MDPNAIDLAGIPTTLAIIGVLVLTALALRYFNKKFPQVAARIKNSTPWMGWAEEATDEYEYLNATTRIPRHVYLNRW